MIITKSVKHHIIIGDSKTFSIATCVHVCTSVHVYTCTCTCIYMHPDE